MQAVFNVLLTKGSLGNSSVGLAVARVSDALESARASYHGRSDIPAVEQVLQSAVPDLFPPLKVSDGHTSTPRGIKSLEEVWADLDIGTYNCYYVRNGRPIDAISAEEDHTQRTARR